MIDRQVRRQLCVLRGALACGTSVGGSWRVTTKRTDARQWASWCCGQLEVTMGLVHCVTFSHGFDYHPLPPQPARHWRALKRSEGSSQSIIIALICADPDRRRLGLIPLPPNLPRKRKPEPLALPLAEPNALRATVPLPLPRLPVQPSMLHD